jgi:serine phosphatase RsbU (regulator of sigma subunit)
MKLSRTFKISGSLLLAAIAGVCLAGHLGPAGDAVRAIGILTLMGTVPVFAVSAVRHLLRGALWRVGSRLFISYVLIAVVPIPFLLGLAYAGAYVIAGQLAARRVEEALLERENDLRLAATRLAARMAEKGGASWKSAYAEIAQANTARFPNLDGVSIRNGAAPQALGPDADDPGVLPKWRPKDDAVFASSVGTTPTLVATQRSPDGMVLLIAKLDADFRRELAHDTGVTATVAMGTFSGGSFDADDFADQTDFGPAAPGRLPAVRRREAASHSSQAEVPARNSEAEPFGHGPFEGQWVWWAMPTRIRVTDWKTGKFAERRLVLLVGSSVAREYGYLFGERDLTQRAGSNWGAVVIRVMGALGVFTAAVYVLAALLAALLVIRIARATRRLSVAFGEIEKGNFSHRATLRGRDQLAGLIQGFNQMASHLDASVAERADKEALERELEVARQLQLRLLPSPDFRFPGVEIATDFRPATLIGGDFYHFVAEGNGRLVVVIADVSGHGLPAGIVMASAEASLAALAATGTDTKAILETLDEEIRKITDSRTFVTLAHTRLVLPERRVEFTNAGHLYPYRVTLDGTVAAIENPARPLGLGLPVTFRTVSAPLAPCDLWVFLSDGIVEATNASGDEFGFERLETLLAAGAGGTAEALKVRILDQWRAFTGRDEPEDDRTLIVVRIVELE